MSCTCRQPRHESNLNIHQQMNKEAVIHLYSGILFAHKKEWTNAICGTMGLPQWFSSKNLPAMQQIQKMWFWPWQLTPVFLPGESHGQRILVEHNPEDHKELYMTETMEHVWNIMDGLRDYHTKRSKLGRERHTSNGNTYTWNLKKKNGAGETCLLNRNRLVDLKGRPVVAKWERCGEGWIEVGPGICTLPYVNYKINKDLLNSTWIYTQYSVITYTVKESEKEWIYEYV